MKAINDLDYFLTNMENKTRALVMGLFGCRATYVIPVDAERFALKAKAGFDEPPEVKVYRDAAREVAAQRGMLKKDFSVVAEGLNPDNWKYYIRVATRDSRLCKSFQDDVKACVRQRLAPQ